MLKTASGSIFLMATVQPELERAAGEQTRRATTMQSTTHLRYVAPVMLTVGFAAGDELRAQELDPVLNPMSRSEREKSQ